MSGSRTVFVTASVAAAAQVRERLRGLGVEVTAVDNRIVATGDTFATTLALLDRGELAELGFVPVVARRDDVLTIDHEAARGLDADELERHIASLPPLVDDPAYLVFADYLQSHGHPWGELVVLQHRQATAPDAELERVLEAKLSEHAELLLGPLGANDNSRFTWHLGFLRTAIVGVPATPEAILAGLEHLLALPAARMLDTIILQPRITEFTTYRSWESSPGNIVEPWPELAAIAELLPARVTHLGLGWPASAAAAYVAMPDFEDLSAPFARLRRLELTGCYRSSRPYPALQLPLLESLELRFSAAMAQELRVFQEAVLPKLERLTVWLGGIANCTLDDAYGPDPDAEEWEDRYPTRYSDRDLAQLDTHVTRIQLSAADLGRFLDVVPASVQHLGLRSTALTAAHVEVIARSPRIARLQSLDLSGGALADDAARVLVELAALVSRLESIDLSRNRLGAPAVAELTAALPNARCGDQDPYREPDFYWRYVATVE